MGSDLELDIKKIVEEIVRKEFNPGSSLKVSSALEHSLLHKGVTEQEIAEACILAKKHNIAGVVVPVWHTAYTAKLLNGSPVKLVTAISFPNGGQALVCKLQDVQQALANNVDEIDVVPNNDLILRGKMQQVQEELAEIIQAAKPRMKVKINIEWNLFSEAQKVEILKMAVSCGADFVKVQHFLAGGKADPEEVKFIRSIVGQSIGVKIDGGIKAAAFCRELMQAGADRMGLTATFKIIEETEKE